MTRTTTLAVTAVAALGIGLAVIANSPTTPVSPQAPPTTPEPVKSGFAADRDPAPGATPWDATRATKYLAALCDLGPRVSGSAGMAKQQELLVKHFEGLGAKVTKQEFVGRQRSKPAGVAMANLVASFNPERKKRVILCTHYDTRPAPHEEPNRQNWVKPFVSANDGTAGVALLMELAQQLPKLATTVGVDVVCFDGEEYIFDLGMPGLREGDEYFLGSRHFAREYTAAKPKLGYQYTAAILLDMCCGTDARLAVEGYSWAFAPQLVTEVWGVAEKQGAKSFKMEQGFRRADSVQDDHLALNEAGILAIDLIDFDYKHWHMLSDTPDKVSAKQTREVGEVLLGWLRKQ